MAVLATVPFNGSMYSTRVLVSTMEKAQANFPWLEVTWDHGGWNLIRRPLVRVVGRPRFVLPIRGCA
jgi:hypothetical protein